MSSNGKESCGGQTNDLCLVEDLKVSGEVEGGWSSDLLRMIFVTAYSLLA